MIVIAEGIDRTGKTSFSRKLQSYGYIRLKDNSRRPQTKEEETAKLLTFSSIVLNLHLEDKVVIDRLHLTEFVYGFIERGYFSTEALDVDEMLSIRDDVFLVLFKPLNLRNCETLHSRSLEQHSKLFEEFYEKSNIKRKFICDINSYADLAWRISKL